MHNERGVFGGLDDHLGEVDRVEEGAHLRRVVIGAFLEHPDRRVVVDAEGLFSRQGVVVEEGQVRFVAPGGGAGQIRNHERSQTQGGREAGHPVKPQRAVEERPVVGHGHGVGEGEAAARPDGALAGEDEEVGGVQGLGEHPALGLVVGPARLHLDTGVKLAEGVVAVHAERQALVPGFVGNHGPGDLHGALVDGGHQVIGLPGGEGCSVKFRLGRGAEGILGPGGDRRDGRFIEALRALGVMGDADGEPAGGYTLGQGEGVGQRHPAEGPRGGRGKRLHVGLAGGQGEGIGGGDRGGLVALRGAQDEVEGGGDVLNDPAAGLQAGVVGEVDGLDEGDGPGERPEEHQPGQPGGEEGAQPVSDLPDNVVLLTVRRPLRAFLPEFQECPGGQQAEAGVDLQEVAQRLGPARAHEQEITAHPDQGQEVRLPLLPRAEHAPGGPPEARPGGQAQERPHAPGDVEHGEEQRRAVGPLLGRRAPADAARFGLGELHGGRPIGVEVEGEEGGVSGGPAEAHRLGQAEGEQGCGGGDRQAKPGEQQDAPEIFGGGEAEIGHIDEGRRQDQPAQREQVDAGGDGHAEGHPKQGIVPPAVGGQAVASPGFLRGAEQVGVFRHPHPGVKGEQREQGGKIIHRHEVGLLDGQHRQGGQGGGQQAGGGVVKPPPDEVEQPEGEAIGEGGQPAAHQAQFVVAGVPGGLGRGTDQDHGPLAPAQAVIRTVLEKPAGRVVLGVGAEGGEAGVEVTGERGGQAELGEGVGQPVLIGVQVGALAPIEVRETEGDTDEDANHESQMAEPARAGTNPDCFHMTPLDIR